MNADVSEQNVPGRLDTGQRATCRINLKIPLTLSGR